MYFEIEENHSTGRVILLLSIFYVLGEYLHFIFRQRTCKFVLFLIMFSDVQNKIDETRNGKDLDESVVLKASPYDIGSSTCPIIV